MNNMVFINIALLGGLSLWLLIHLIILWSVNFWVSPTQLFQKIWLKQQVFSVHFYFIFCFPRVSCYNLSLNKKVLIHSTSCLYTKHQTLVSEVFAVVFAASLSLVEDEVGTCWLLSYLCVLPCPWVVLETCYGKRVCRCQCSLSL